MSDLLNILDLIGLGSATNEVYQLLHGDHRHHLSFNEVQVRIEQILLNHHVPVKAETVVDILVLHKIIKVHVTGHPPFPTQQVPRPVPPLPQSTAT